MAGSLPPLSEAQAEIMNVVWDRGEATWDLSQRVAGLLDETRRLGVRADRRLVAGVGSVLLAACLLVAGLWPLAAASAGIPDDDPPSAKEDAKATGPLKALRIPRASPVETQPPWERPLLTTPALTEEERQALWQFRKAYVLQPGEVLRRIGSPPPLGRILARVLDASRHGSGEEHRQYWRDERTQWEALEAQQAISNQVYRWRHGEPVWVRGVLAQPNDPGSELGSLIELISGLPALAVEGDPDLRKTRVPGDFLIREGTPVEALLTRLGEILRGECKLPVKLAFRDVGRRVVVVRGRYQFRSVARPNDRRIVIAPSVPNDLRRYFGDSGNFEQFLYSLGSMLGALVVDDDVEAIPARLQWAARSNHLPREERDRVLELITEQTGLTFTEVTHRVRILFVERAD